MPARLSVNRRLGAALLATSIVAACGLSASAATATDGRSATDRSPGAGATVSASLPSVGVAGAPLKDPQEYIVLREARQDLPSASVGLPFAVADLNADGEPDIIQGQGKSLKWMGPNQTPLTDVPALASPVASICVSNLQGDGVQDVIVSTAETGAVYVYRVLDGALKRASQTPHIWTSTDFALSLKIDGDSKRELLGLTSSGVGYLYRQTTQGWFRLWRGPMTPDVAKAAQSGDVNGDGLDEVALVTSKGRLQLFRYQLAGLRICSDLDVGDPVEQVAIADIDADGRSDILALSSQHVLTVLSWDTGELKVRSRYLLGDVFGPVLLAADVDSDGRTEFIIGGRNRQLGLYRWQGTALHILGKVTWLNDVISASWQPSTGLTLVDGSGLVSKVRLLKSDYVRVQVGTQEYTPTSTPIMREGRVYLSARDASTLFGLAIAWDQARKLTILSQGDAYFGLKADSTEYYAGSRKALDKLEAAPTSIDGRLFIPLKVLHRLFGVQAEWKADTRTVQIGTSVR